MKWLNERAIRLVLAGIAGVAMLADASAKADFVMGDAVNVGPAINGPGEDYGPNISADGLEFYFESDRPDGLGGFDIWMATRQTADDEWGSAVNLGSSVNSDSDDSSPCISGDGLELYFSSTRAGGSGMFDIWVTTRATRKDPWGPPTNLGAPINTPYDEFDPSISSDGLSLFFSDLDVPETPIRLGGQGQSDIWVTTRASKATPWGEPINLGPVVNSAEHDTTPAVSDDGLTLAFGRGSFEAADLWLTRRKTIDDLWEAPVKLGLQTGIGDWEGWEGTPDISRDGATIYWTSYRAGGMGNADIWQVSITPLVDFNGDGRVGGFEFTKVVDNWGRNEPACDVGPMPMGNGVVDVQDLLLLSQYIGKEVDDPTLIAHWALDEAEGDIAHDNLGENHAMVVGDAVWQPARGAVDGALSLDGINDYIATEAMRDPSAGPMSVFAWVKGGGPGQALVSQILGANWLTADASGGCLMTDLKQSGRLGKALVSETVITDGNWHRVGLVWDGANRMLYVDDEVVAADTQSNLVGSGGGLNIGCDKNQTPDSFWSGLIDDVRIFNRALAP